MNNLSAMAQSAGRRLRARIAGVTCAGLLCAGLALSGTTAMLGGALVLGAAVAPGVAVAAETRLNAQEFDAYTRGKTFYFGSMGRPYGAEEYLDGQRVRWSFLDGECKDGRWYEEAGLICFVYEDNPDPQCWSFEIGGSGLIARFQNDPAQSELYEVEQSPEPLMCLGPRIGA